MSNPTQLSYGNYIIEQPSARGCPHCGGIQFVHFQVDRTGYSVGTGHHHTSNCRTNFCPHGTRLTPDTDCPKCLAEEDDGQHHPSGDES